MNIFISTTAGHHNRSLVLIAQNKIEHLHSYCDYGITWCGSRSNSNLLCHLVLLQFYFNTNCLGDMFIGRKFFVWINETAGSEDIFREEELKYLVHTL